MTWQNAGPLAEGLKPRTETPRSLEEQFVYGEKAKAERPAPARPPEPAPAAAAPAAPQRPPTGRRGRSAACRSPPGSEATWPQALKRASLERQLEGVEPYTVQDMLESALEPWLKANGYLD